MRLAKYFIFLFIITCLSLLYTHQQFLIIRANYNIKNYETRVSQLLDHNKKLMYNITTLESPASLEVKLSTNGIDYDMPRRWAVQGEEKSIPTYGFATVAERRNVVMERILNFVAVKAEAQALEN